MISRLTRTAQTLGVVVLAYFAYALLAAPLIEPRIDILRPKWERNSRSHATRIDLSLFPADAWERGQPKVLETSQGTLLFDDYRQLDNGDLELPHCTLISYIDPPKRADTPKPSGPPTRSAGPQEGSSDKLSAPADRDNRAKTRTPSALESQRRPVVMRASEGALLRFDSPPNFVMGKFSRLVGGQLQGDVTIYSPSSSSKDDDSLLITTKNIQIDQERIWAPSQVDFRFGKNRAKGRDLSIYLEPPKRRTANKKAAMGGIRSLELIHVDEVSLQFEGDLFAMVTGKQSNESPAKRPETSAIPTSPATPIEIKCDGPFRFNFDALMASLEERVDVIRHNPDGPSDQLNCELLEIHFMPKAKESDQPATGGTESSPVKQTPTAMQPKKLIAVGFPAMVRAPSMRAGARAKRMEYDFTTRRVELSGDEKTTLHSDQYYVEAPRLEYELLEGGRLGRLQAAGPGLARGQMGKEKRPFEATWLDRVSLLPQGKNKVLSMIGQANLKMAGVASLKADELHLYLLEVPRPQSDQVDVVADRMRAAGNIELDSPQLIAFLAEAQIWFRNPTAAENEASKAETTPRRDNSGLLGRTSGPAESRNKKLRLTAGVLRGQILLTESPQLEALDLQNNVRINEYQPVAKSALDIAAQRVVLEQGHTSNAELTLSGAPARFSAEGMTVDGTVIRVQLANNLASVEGPGSMLMLPQHVALDAEGQSKPLNVRWQRGMRFDGLTARFEGEIEARGGHVTKDRKTVHFVASGDVLEVVLSRAVQFSDPETTGVDVGRLTFPGMARVDSRAVDPAGNITSVDSMTVRGLVLNRQTGRVTGQGPGQVIHRGPNPQKKQHAREQVPELIFLRVEFENQFVGNIDQREMEFLNGTRTIFGPISNWEQSLDPQHPEQLGENGVILTSQRLAVADMREVVGDQTAIEVEATGNAQVRGRQFAASGDRVSYIRAKDQLVLEGLGRTKSTLEFQRPGGGDMQELRANRILFYPQTRQFALDGFELELKDVGIRTQPPNGQATYGQAPNGQAPNGQTPYTRNPPPPYNQNPTLPARSPRFRPTIPPAQAYRRQPNRTSN